ncbi:MarR family transcriptional regulator [Sphingobium sp. 22B]|uniref:MarR family winged helix-turn-helix transcriptional regulator n=1 Tax=unclassified Sphingobium TaxID=2611147 RepID=UPI000785B809|nr:MULTISPECIES: MarR family transcriptional regulator [unclassified Sphingobium]KXU33173.1 MarR family transcriptional regulator [Sphingobium sp. AM]KYC29842.1 MarR family transcriptional regulator [Sphingobium sp. 22B]OAP29423.1 MarR family transcriptional regulator [Sphingobium sp. 20006FA]
MTGRARTGEGRRDLEACRAALEAHYAVHRTIPSMAGLARLWDYASKSSASRRVDQLIEAGVLLWSTDRRLAPGPAFRILPDPQAQVSDAPHLNDTGPNDNGRHDPDPLQAALAAWATDYDPVLVRAYSVTTRLLRLARSMERHMTQSAAREGLTSGDVLLLDALYRVGPPHRIAPTALKHYFLMSLAGVAKRVDRLEALGFIRRVPNPDDRRGLFIELTHAGRAALTRLVAVDRTAPHILWPTMLSDQQYQAMIESLTVAEAVVAAADQNDRSEFPPPDM